jgi:hypothetical protein
MTHAVRLKQIRDNHNKIQVNISQYIYVFFSVHMIVPAQLLHT